MFNGPSAEYFDPNADYQLRKVVYYRELSTPKNYEICQDTIANLGQEQLGHHCDSNALNIDVELQEDGTYAVCERNRGWASSADVIGGNYPTEDEARQCLAKLGAWLLLYAAQDDWPIETYQTLDDVREEYKNLVDDWDGEDIGELIELLQEAKKFDANIDMASLPGAPIPDDIDTSYPVWAMDRSGNMLVGNDADQTMTIEEYRSEIAEGD